MDRVASHGDRIAVRCSAGQSTYAELHAASHAVASALLADRDDLDGDRIAFLAAPGLAYVAILLGIWRAGGVAAPLCVSHPLPEIEYVLKVAGAAAIPDFSRLTWYCREFRNFVQREWGGYSL